MSELRCAATCLNDLQCYSIDLCSTVDGEKCRRSKGKKPTCDPESGPSCQRYHIEDGCDGVSYADRKTEVCTFDECSDCDCVSTYTQKSEVYSIMLAGDRKNVYCSFESDYSWTILQRRLDGSENFYRNWTDYELGFGIPESEFWLGNKYIHQLTADGHTTLRIELEDHDGNTVYAEYSSFSVDDKSNSYRIQVSGYSGNAGDSFAGTCNICINGMPFTTYDRDNDNHQALNCAVWSKGGWWYNSCHRSNLNGLYGDNSYGQGVNWEEWKTLRYSLKSSTLKLRKS